MVEAEEKPVEKLDQVAQMRFWLTELKLSERYREQWDKQAAKVLRRFEAKDGGAHELYDIEGPKKARIDWANIQMQRASLYGKTPQALISRRKSAGGSSARVAAQILEEATAFSIEQDQDFDDVASRCLFDFLTIAKGAVRERLDIVREETTEVVALEHDEENDSYLLPDGTLVDKPKDLQQMPDGTLIGTVTYQKLVKANSRTEYIHWRDFRHNPARTWDEVKWVGYRSYLTRREFKERFKNINIKDVSFNVTAEGLEDDESDIKLQTQSEFEKVEVWEIWNKPDKRVYWVTAQYKEGLLDVDDDLYGLREFFPSPRPCMMMTSNDTTLPTPSAIYTKDQLDEIDDLTDRIGEIVAGIRNSGLCNEEFADAINSMLEEDNQLVPIEGWANFVEQGGLENQTSFLPIKQTADVLQVLLRTRAESKMFYDEIAGISDLLRGNSNPHETAAAQNIKSEFANRRFEYWRAEVQRFLRDAIRIKAELIAIHYSEEILAEITNIEEKTIPIDPQEFSAAVEILKQDDIRNYKIEIETDLHTFKDSELEKQTRNEFLLAVSQFLPQSMEISKAFPEFTDAMNALLMFVVQTYKPGRRLEGVFEAGIEAVKQSLEEAKQNQQPDPAQIQAQQVAEANQLKMQIEQAKLQIEGQKQQAEALQKEMEVKVKMFEAQESASNAQAKLEAQITKDAELLRLKQAEIELKIKELELKERELAIKEIDVQITAELKKADMEAKIAATAINQAGAMQKQEEQAAPPMPRTRTKTLVPQRDPQTGEIISATITEEGDL